MGFFFPYLNLLICQKCSLTEVRDEILAFNTRCGDGIFHGWNTASELWKFEIFPRTTIMMQHTSAIH